MSKAEPRYRIELTESQLALLARCKKMSADS